MKTRYRIAALALGLVALAALVYHFGTGHRYRLYTDAYAGDCWRAVELTTLSSSTIRTRDVGAAQENPDGRVTVSIDYRMDRVLAGKTLNVRCVFAAADRLESIEFDGVALDPATLADVNRQLGGS